MVSFLLASLLAVVPIVPISSDTTFVSSENIVFKVQKVIVQGDTLYRGVSFDDAFNKEKGFWTLGLTPLYSIEKGMSSLTSMFNSGYQLPKDIDLGLPLNLPWYWEGFVFSTDKNDKDNRWFENIVYPESKWLYTRYFFPKEHRWIICKAFIGSSSDYKVGSVYDDEMIRKQDWYPSDIIWDFLALLIVFIFGLYIFLAPLSGEDRPRIISNRIAWLLALCFSVGYCTLSGFVRKQMATPIIIMSGPFLLCRFIRNSKIKKSMQGLCALMMLLGEGYQFLRVNESVSLGDGSVVQIHWKVGTDIYKRFHVKKMIGNMLPIKVSDSSEDDYTVYLNRYEFSERDYDFISDSFFAFLGSTDPYSSASFRECQIMTERLSMLTGLTFDIPTLNEWLSAVDEEDEETDGDNAKMADERNVYSGRPNGNGLYNLTSNVAEYTSSYNPKLRIGLSGESLLESFDFVFVGGSAYDGVIAQWCLGVTERSDSVLLSVSQKNHNLGDVGFRLAYRPENVGKREFSISGFIREDIKPEIGNLGYDYPEEIILESLNDVSVSSIPNYETLQERLIESLFTEKRIKATDVSTNKEVSFSMPPGLEYYDFVPEFHFHDVVQKQVLILP